MDSGIDQSLAAVALYDARDSVGGKDNTEQVLGFPAPSQSQHVDADWYRHEHSLFSQHLRFGAPFTFFQCVPDGRLYPRLFRVRGGNYDACSAGPNS